LLSAQIRLCCVENVEKLNVQLRHFASINEKLEIATVSIKFIVIIFSSHILGIILIGLDGYF